MLSFNKTVYVLFNPTIEKFLDKRGYATGIIYEADWWDDAETAKTFGEHLDTFEVRKMKVNFELMSD